jgi:hypothetical protein
MAEADFLKSILRFYSEVDPELYGKKYWFTQGKYLGVSDGNAVLRKFLNFMVPSIRTLCPVLCNPKN